MSSRNYTHRIAVNRPKTPRKPSGKVARATAPCKWCGRETDAPSGFCRSCVMQGFHWVYDFTGSQGAYNRRIGERWSGVVFRKPAAVPYPIYPSDPRYQRRQREAVERLAGELATA